MQTESLCDRYANPGRCCRDFALADRRGRDLYPIRLPKHVVRRKVKLEGLPFTPMSKGDKVWLFSCSRLTEAGRCGMYGERPEVCRAYEPGSSEACRIMEGNV